MRKVKFAVGYYYHIYNRGNNKQPIFLNDRDKIRFLFHILYYQSPITFPNIHRQVTYFVKHQVFNINSKNILKNRLIELVNFTLMPNHFHLTIKENRENGISRYMQRVLDGYTKYFNTKYERAGHLFQGPFQAVHIKNNEQLLYLSAYVHRNPSEIKKWKNKEDKYPWSSYQDFIGKNRWGELLKREIILKQFSENEKYRKFVETSGAKVISKNVKENLLLDFN